MCAERVVQTPAEKDTAFRADVEGLRALAVLVVLAFHNGWGAVFSGGFVGVDIFFVISGYLITRNILSQAAAGSFSFRDFYLRRVRRLFPALLCTVTATLLAGLFLSSPTELLHIAQSGTASIFSVSNFYFWNQAGYFDVAAIQKPLLHTWSLSVEEQFYLVWPVLVILIAARMRNRTYAIAFLVALGAAAVFAAERAIGSDASAVFYLTPYRIGEFALGAICAWLPARRPLPRALEEALALLGLAAVLYAVFAYTDATRFPGLNAMLPCAGAALIIRFGSSRSAQLLLANRPTVFIGRISYSLYLVHWPLIVFFRQEYGQPNMLEASAIALCSVLLAAAMYRYVEQPYRMRGHTAPPRVPAPAFFKLFGGLTACATLCAAAIWTGGGWSWRFPDNLARLTQEAAKERAARFDPYRKRCLARGRVSCDVPGPGVNVFILGDSHAPDAFNALVAQYPSYHYVFLSVPGCPPLVRENYALLTAKHPHREKCIELNEKSLYSDRLAKADLVVINMMFSDWFRPEHFAHSIAKIKAQSAAPIVVLGNYLIFKEPLPDLVVRHGNTTMDAAYQARLAPRTDAFDEELETLSTRLGFTYISKRELLCRDDSLQGCPLMFGDKLFTYDEHHLSLAAAQALGVALKSRYGEHFADLDRRHPTEQP